MAQLTGKARAKYVQSMFTSIAKRYDRMNRLMTGGQDIHWRQIVIQRAQLTEGNLVLDLGTGTGDLAFEAKRQVKGCIPVGGDFTLEMIRVGQERDCLRSEKDRIFWSGMDALSIPFPENTFGAVISGFLMRNVYDISLTLAEQYRVIKPGGTIVILDTTRPSENILTPLVEFHMNKIIPVLGKMVTGVSEAYRYLPDSTYRFLSAEELAVQMINAGFHCVSFTRMMFGTVAIHWGRK